MVPQALATDDGGARRVVPDISANAESDELIGYTGAVTSDVYGQVLEGGTSEAAPLFAGLEADAVQAVGHPLGFLTPPCINSTVTGLSGTSRRSTRRIRRSSSAPRNSWVTGTTT